MYNLDSPSEDLDEYYMRLAIAESVRARGVSTPNPPVGAILVSKQGEIKGRGFTQPVGKPHAEIMCLQQAGDYARDSTLYVTLEPCNHYGRTPPCSLAIISAGVSRVVYGVKDPHETAAGGHHRLISHGVQVRAGVLENDIAYGVLFEWLFSIKHKRPCITAKIATSIDGKISSAHGIQSFLTQAEANRHSHTEREQLDAIMVGTSTVLIDNPRLTARFSDRESRRQPLRVVVGNRKIPSHYHVHDDTAQTVFIPRNSPRTIVETLQGHTNILLEGGAILIRKFLEEDLIDRFQIYVAPIIFGSGHDAFSTENSLDSLAAHFPHQYQALSTQLIGSDVFTTFIRQR